MPKYEIEIVKAITDRYIVTANDEDEAQELVAHSIATYGDLKPHYTKFGEMEIYWREVDESP